MSPNEIWEANPYAWLAALVQSSDDAIVGKTLDSVIRSWNVGAERLFGYKHDEIIGQSVLVLIPPELQAEETQIVSRLSRGERVEHFETVRLRKDHSPVEVSLSVSPIRGPGGGVVGAAKIARDVGEAKRLRRAEMELSDQLQHQAAEMEEQIEEALTLQEALERTNRELQDALLAARTAREQAEKADRLKGHFLATMSHELRTPLNAIGGYVELLEMGLRGAITDEQRQDLSRIRLNQEALLRRIEDVLNFSRMEAGRVELHRTNVRIDDLLKTVEGYVGPSLRTKGLTYRFAPCGAEAVVYADPDRVQQITMNLLANAVKFTNDGSVEVRCAVRNDSVHIQVVDTGPGIPAEWVDAIFEPFVRAETKVARPADGTGLGLTISRQLAREMGGDITVRSSPGRGSTFTLTLPKAKG